MNVTLMFMVGFIFNTIFRLERLFLEKNKY